jgi:hypothetical protein
VLWRQRKQVARNEERELVSRWLVSEGGASSLASKDRESTRQPSARQSRVFNTRDSNLSQDDLARRDAGARLLEYVKDFNS